MRTSNIPMIVMKPVWLLKFPWLLQEAYIHHLTTEKENNCNVSFMCLVPFKYFNTLFIFPKSYPSAILTILVKNGTAICIYLLHLVIINKNFDTEWWNIFGLSSSKNSAYDYALIFNRWFVSVLVYVSLNASGNSSMTFCKYLII